MKLQEISKTIIKDFTKLSNYASKYLIKQKNDNQDFDKNVSQYYASDNHNNFRRPYQRKNQNRPIVASQQYQSSSYEEKQSIQLKNSPFIPQNQNSFGEDNGQVLMLKRPRNAYNIFIKSQTVKIKQQNPHMRAPDIVRIAAERYNNMSQEQKRPYIQKFQQAKRIFDSQQMNSGNRFNQQPTKRGRGSRGRGAKFNDYSLK